MTVRTDLPNQPGYRDDEVTMLNGFLDYYRVIMIRKAEGLTDEQARFSLPPSELSILGMIRHLSEVERYWFGECFANETLPDLYSTADNPNGDFHPGPEVTLADALAALRTDIERSQVITKGMDPAATSPLTDQDPASLRPRPSLRWIMLHMLEEYARHCGHADLLREHLDGTVGD